MNVYFYIAAVVAVVSLIGIILLMVYLFNSGKSGNQYVNQYGNQYNGPSSYSENHPDNYGYAPMQQPVSYDNGNLKTYFADDDSKTQVADDDSKTQFIEDSGATQEIESVRITFTDEAGNCSFADMFKILNIGRSGSNGFIIKDPKTSGMHCRLIEENREMYIEDLNSTNGTFVNGLKITSKTPLRSGDTVAFGQVKYRINY